MEPGGEAGGAEAQRLAHLRLDRRRAAGVQEGRPATEPGRALRGLRGGRRGARPVEPQRRVAPAVPGGAGATGRQQTSHPQARAGVRRQQQPLLPPAVLHRLPAHRLERLDHRAVGVLWELLRRELSGLHGRRPRVGLVFPHGGGEPVPNARDEPWIHELLLHPHQTQHHVHALLRR